MPKINIYVPDDLAEEVRSAGLPISRICQQALREALRAPAGGAVGTTTSPLVDAEDVPVGLHVAAILDLAAESARARGSAEVSPADLLRGIATEGESLVLRTIEQCGVTREAIIGELDKAADPGRTQPARGSRPLALDADAERVVEQAVGEARTMQTPMLDGGHLLAALLDDTTSAGEALRALGVDRIFTTEVSGALRGAVEYSRVTEPRQDAYLVVTLTALAARLDRIETAVGVSSTAGADRSSDPDFNSERI